MSRFGSIAVAATLFFGLAGAAHANLVSDGSFSSPYGGGGFTTYGGGSTMGAWTVTGGSVDLIGGYWQAPGSVPGTGSVDLDGNAPGGLTQSIATLAGHTYQLSFALSGNPDGSPATKTLDISAGSLSTSVSYTIGSNTHGNMMYATENFLFTATGPTLLTFSSTDVGTPYGPVIGDVVVSASAVPEPATLAILGAGLAGLGLIRRKKI